MAILKQLEDRYVILERLRESGVGATYKVRHRQLNEVRMVVTRPRLHGDADQQIRFLPAAHAVSRLGHANLVRVFDSSVGEDGAFVALELIEGLTLAEVLTAAGPPPLPLTLEIARQGLRAVGHLHEHHLVHRDVSPDNLMLTRDADGRPRVKLVDLGIASEVRSDDRSAGAGGFVRYAAPETFDHQEAGDPRSDLYSFALVLYELLTGRFPIDGEGAPALIAGHLFRPPIDFAESDPRGLVPEQIRRAVLKGLAKSRDERFVDAESFAGALATGFALDVSSPDVQRFLELTRDDRPSDQAPRLDLEPVPTRILRPPPADESPSEIAPTRILRPSPGATSATAVEQAEAETTTLPVVKQAEAEQLTERFGDDRVPDAMRVEAALAQRPAASEESTTVIRGPVAPGGVAPEAEPAIGPAGLDATLRNIRALRDDGRAGEAFERLNRAVREYGPQPTLKILRDELGEALLERDVEEEESASQIFEVDDVPPPGEAPPQLLGDASSRGLSDATIRPFEPPVQPHRDRPGPPTAHPTRNMVAAGLVLVAVFAAAVFLVSRRAPVDEQRPLAAEDVAAADLSPGSLALDAVPWAEIVALENPALEDPPPISPSRFTPVILRLPPGEYRISLRYPPSGQVEERVVRVDSDIRAEERVTFESLDATSYFERVGW